MSYFSHMISSCDMHENHDEIYLCFHSVNSQLPMDWRLMHSDSFSGRSNNLTDYRAICDDSTIKPTVIIQPLYAYQMSEGICVFGGGLVGWLKFNILFCYVYGHIGKRQKSGAGTQCNSLSKRLQGVFLAHATIVSFAHHLASLW